MKILITGTAGFIGFHLAERLLRRGDIVLGLDNINDYYDQQLKYDRLKEHGIIPEYGKVVRSTIWPNYRFLQFDLTDNMAWLFKMERFDVVCNLAAQAGVRHSITHPEAYINSNIVGFSNIIELSKGVDHFVYASSSSVYGKNDIPFSIRDRVDNPVSLYAATKKSNELVAHVYSHLYDLPTTGVRFFTVYGPWGRPDMALFIFTQKILNDEPIDVYNYGNMERDFTYIDDIIDGLVLIIDHPDGYKIYNIGNSNPVHLMDFISLIERFTGKKAKTNLMPMQMGDVPKTWASVTALQNDLGYKPQTNIEHGIEQFINWYKEYNKI